MKPTDILFKAKRVDTNEWVEGYYVYDRPWNEHKMVTYNNLTTNRISIESIFPSTLCMWTTLTDKNGKKIFEGDILTISEECRNKESTWKEWKGIVVWSDNDIYSAGFRLVLNIDKQAYGNRPLCQKTKDESSFIIIGSIHDNPVIEKL